VGTRLCFLPISVSPCGSVRHFPVVTEGEASLTITMLLLL
jgi:hypothetical protein